MQKFLNSNRFCIFLCNNHCQLALIALTVMKKILGLDLGVSSIGWALVNEAENKDEKSSIIKLGVRVNPLTVDEKGNFEKGKSITTNAGRTLKRGMRRNLQRYKLRRENLIEVLKANRFISDDTVLSEDGKGTTFQTLRLRAKATSEGISLEELARVLLNINKKRGYKSNRKCKSTKEDGQIIDSIALAKQLYDKGYTPGEYVYNELISADKWRIPSFYRSDLENEFDRIFAIQSEFYPELTLELKEELNDKNESQTWAIIAQRLNLVGAKKKLNGKDAIKDNYKIRVDGLRSRLEAEDLATALAKVNKDIKNAGGYLGDISDRNKILVTNGLTVGQYLMSQLEKDPNVSLKDQVFYRSDYMDEFDKIWNTQRQFHSELTDALKHEIRDIIIFYQRPLRSQKGLISNCEFEPQRKVAPKSSPIYQEFRIYQELGNLTVGDNLLSDEDRQMLYEELSIRKSLSISDIRKLLKVTPGTHINCKQQVDGNRTQAALYEAYARIIEESGNGEHDFSKMRAADVKMMISDIFSALGAKTDFLNSDISEESAFFALWHLLYSYAGDNSKSGQEGLERKIMEITGLPMEYARIMANVTFEPDYGSLSAKAIRNILPFLKEGYQYSDACEQAGYRHSARSLTREEIASKEYKAHLEGLPKNTLRNPVVEKILNQMVNVVNAVIDEYGKPDEVRIELARELKKSAEERDLESKAISAGAKRNEDIKGQLKKEFNIANPTRGDVIRYKLYEELASNGYKTLYSNVKIDPSRLFTSDYNIEHIIPQSRLFDDSFSNKTIELTDINKEKGNRTAYDYVQEKYGAEAAQSYVAKVEKLGKEKSISGTKARYLLMREADIPTDFINRDLRDSQYIARKAKEMLEDLVKTVTSTTGSVTARLREDWQLVDVMKELNWDKYEKRGRTQMIEGKNHQMKGEIMEWTKRNDHRHHAMDALTIAFTKPSYIQYLNNLNARVFDKKRDDFADFDMHDVCAEELKSWDKTRVVSYIEAKEMHSERNGDSRKLRFNSPMPLDELRASAKENLENILVSIKAKNKVVTKNKNVIKLSGGQKKAVIQLTPRGRLHEDTFYGNRYRYVTKEENVGSAFNENKISTVACKRYKEALLKRLSECDGDVKKAFCGANSLGKKPLWIDALHTERVPQKVKTVTLEPYYTIRKSIDPDLKIDKVLDSRARRILEARLNEFKGDAKRAFANLDENPIWFDKQRGLKLKTVTIGANVDSVEPLHGKRDKDGNQILTAGSERIPVDYVKYGDNHHIAIYKDSAGHLQESVVTFYEAVSRKTMGQPVIDKEFNKGKGWQFLFSMKKNEYFVFPNPETGFDPNEIDLLDSKNYSKISKNLYRVQSISIRDYKFRHHLETTDTKEAALENIIWKRIRAVDKLKNIVKVRVNHIGQIVQVGEY